MKFYIPGYILEAKYRDLGKKKKFSLLAIENLKLKIKILI